MTNTGPWFLPTSSCIDLSWAFSLSFWFCFSIPVWCTAPSFSPFSAPGHHWGRHMNMYTPAFPFIFQVKTPAFLVLNCLVPSKVITIVMTRATYALVLMVENTITQFPPKKLISNGRYLNPLAGWYGRMASELSSVKTQSIGNRNKSFESVRPEFWSGLSYLLAALLWAIYFTPCVSVFLHCKMRVMIVSISLGGIRVKWYTIYNLLTEVNSIKLWKINFYKVIFINSWAFPPEFTWY